ncbi:outer membrane protein [Desulfocurvibacter africanus]|uniref:OmpA domain protein transmembrane region-containing protein n=1 Tax=Desulfocurvibacter africanus subsp. africanus str. Walvis Bay TaxID=690850 RepID=F3YUU8_DESAF|nr:outer membrane beta-barrel protein [Desulfocurvibacter africanus]EGJ49125.1 OmpA domain protein transmembrane region-containing protein [Desulfocurvibacter africanus subsp. africanus str. Walvis Bay]
MKSILLCLSMMILPTLAAAATPFDGFYVGGQAGLGALHTYMELEDADNDEQDDQGDWGLGPTGGIFFGGGGAIKDAFYLGGEIDAAYHGLSADPTSEETLDLNWSFGARIRIGGVIADDHLLYTMLGLRVGLFEYDNRTGYDYEFENGCCDCDQDDDDCDDDNWGSEEKPVLGGASVGLGYEYAITDHLGMRTEVGYTFYAPLEYEYISGARQYWDESIYPSVLDATLGLVWHF